MPKPNSGLCERKRSGGGVIDVEPEHKVVVVTAIVLTWIFVVVKG